MKIIPLGTNGFFPSFDRATAYFVILYKETLIILDAGTGLFRLAEPAGKRLLKDVDCVHIFLSHYHLDHTFGFYGAFQLLKNKKVTVFAQTGRQVFWEFVTLKHFPVDYNKVHRNFLWKEIHEGKNKIADYEVRVRKQYHRGEGSLAFRLKFKGREMAYVTDSEPTYESIDFVKNVPLLLHEHEVSEKDRLRKGKLNLEEFIDDGHVTTMGAAIIAREAKVGKLALIHHFPFDDNEKLEKQLKIARSIFPDTILAKGLNEIEF